MAEAKPSELANSPQLTRGVGAWGAVAVNVANMIGTGVFLKARVMTCNVGSPDLVLLVWVCAGLLSLAGTFSYSEIAAMMPEAGGDYVYLRRAYGRLVGFLCSATIRMTTRDNQDGKFLVGRFLGLLPLI
jgi:APA family basic amino acid/polyamine antiporter